MEEDWINSHISIYDYFGTSTRLLIPDNLKVGILSHKKHEDPVINRAFSNWQIIPSRDDIKTIQENLGHHSVPFAIDTYAHVTDAMRKESSEKMDALIKSL